MTVLATASLLVANPLQVLGRSYVCARVGMENQLKERKQFHSNFNSET